MGVLAGLLVSAMLLLSSLRAWAGNTHSNTGDAALEQRAWWGDALGGGYVIATPANLCLHGTSGTASVAAGVLPRLCPQYGDAAPTRIS